MCIIQYWIVALVVLSYVVHAEKIIDKHNDKPKEPERPIKSPFNAPRFNAKVPVQRRLFGINVTPTRNATKSVTCTITKQRYTR
jgi:hypothetical protein